MSLSKSHCSNLPSCIMVSWCQLGKQMPNCPCLVFESIMKLSSTASICETWTVITSLCPRKIFFECVSGAHRNLNVGSLTSVLHSFWRLCSVVHVCVWLCKLTLYKIYLFILQISYTILCCSHSYSYQVQ